jgi:Na+-translocating ferredoxin:NAD+ oxidoreductase RnfD subunit
MAYHLKFIHRIPALLVTLFTIGDFANQLDQRIHKHDIGLIIDGSVLLLILLCLLFVVWIRNTFWSVHLFYVVGIYIFFDMVTIFAFHPGFYTLTHLFSELTLTTFFLCYPEVFKLETKERYSNQGNDIE